MNETIRLVRDWEKGARDGLWRWVKREGDCVWLVDCRRVMEVGEEGRRL